MEAFTYLSPTEVLFGKDTEEQTGSYVKKYGGTRILLVYGGGSVIRSGLLDRVHQSLKTADCFYLDFGEAKANPTLEHAEEGVRKALEAGIDFVLGIGGGSAIDTAKAIAIGAANPSTDLWDFWNRKATVTNALPTGAVLTIPAAGSETSNSSVLTNTVLGCKRGLGSEFNRPKFAIINPELAYTLPTYQIACGVTDIMMHTLDRYFNPTDNEVTDAIAEALLRTVIAKGRIALTVPHDYDSMSELMWAGSLSHNGLTGLGGPGDFAVHQLGHELSAMFDIAHGASLAAVWGSWANAVWDAKPSRFARYARNVWGLSDKNETRLVQAGIQATVDYFAEIGMPTCFSESRELGIQTEETLRDLAFRCSYQNSRTIGTFQILSEEDIYNIYKEANR